MPTLRRMTAAFDKAFGKVRPILEARKKATIGYLQKLGMRNAADETVSAATVMERPESRPVTAIELARHLQLGGSREYRRRAVRQIIEHLHNDGYRICADCHSTEGGYWLARHDIEWAQYQEARKARTRFEFVRLRRMREKATDQASGQQTIADWGKKVKL